MSTKCILHELKCSFTSIVKNNSHIVILSPLLLIELSEFLSICFLHCLQCNHTFQNASSGVSWTMLKYITIKCPLLCSTINYLSKHTSLQNLIFQGRNHVRDKTYVVTIYAIKQLSAYDPP